MIDQERRALLDEIYAFGQEHGGMWNLHPDAGAFIHVLLQAIVARQVLEIGTSNGYSTIWITDALESTGGWLTSLEAEPEKVRMATENLERAKLSERVEIVQGDARESMQSLTKRFDFVLIDADKPSYEHYLDEALQRSRPGAIIMADNVDSHAEELAGFLERVGRDPWLEDIRLPYGGGQVLMYVRPGR